MVLWILHLAYDIKRAGQWFKFRNGLLVEYLTNTAVLQDRP